MKKKGRGGRKPGTGGCLLFHYVYIYVVVTWICDFIYLTSDRETLAHVATWTAGAQNPWGDASSRCGPGASRPVLGAEKTGHGPGEAIIEGIIGTWTMGSDAYLGIY